MSLLLRGWHATIAESWIIGRSLCMLWDGSTVDRATRRRLYNLCDPSQPLEPGDPRYVDVDALGVRGASWVDEVARRIDLSERPVCELLAAPVGAGVTTEVLRLEKKLREKVKLLVVHIDTEAVLDVRAPIDGVDVLMAMLGRTEEEIARSRRGREGPATAVFWSLSVGTAPQSLNASWEQFRDDPEMRQRVRFEANANLTRFMAEARGTLTVLNHAARVLGFEGIVIVVDGLEKLTATLSDRAQVLDSAERLFMRGAPWLSIPVHTVFTLPLAVLPRLHVPATVLPMIALFDREGVLRDPSYRAAQAIVVQRVPPDALSAMFGRDAARSIYRLIAVSGGSPRQLVRSLQGFIAESPLDDERFNRTLSMQFDEFRRAISQREAAWLAGVAHSKSLEITDENRDVAEGALLRGAVVPYRNGSLWWDLHPAVRDSPAVAEAMKALRNYLP